MRLPRITSRIVLSLFAASMAWVLLVIAAPFMVSAGALQDLSGVVGGHENEDQFSDLPLIPHVMYWLGDAECHQLAERSYFLNDNQMPFCARDLGLFIGFPIGFGLLSFRRLVVNPFLALAGLVPMALDGGLQAVTSYESTNPLRLATGMVAGIALSILLSQFVFAAQGDRKGATPNQDGKTT